MKQIKKQVQRGLLDPNKDDPFELFMSSTQVRADLLRSAAPSRPRGDASVRTRQRGGPGDAQRG